MLTLRMAWRNAWRSRRRTGIVVSAVAVGISGTLLSMAVNYGMVFQMVDTAIATELGVQPLVIRFHRFVFLRRLVQEFDVLGVFHLVLRCEE